MFTKSTKQLFAALLFTAALTGCIKGTPLPAATADRNAVSGTFDLITYGCRQPMDVETAAFLVDSSKAERFELFVLEKSYKVKKGLSAAEAFEQADTFVRCGGMRTVETTVVHSIPDGSGGIIGYELLARYSPQDDAGPMPLIVNYSLREGKVTVFIRLSPEAERGSTSFSPSGGSSAP